MPVDKKYSDFVKSLARSGENRTFLNSDEDKAVDVMVNLFHVSNDEVRIFAGNLCNNVGNNSEYIIALSEFIERGGKLYILLNDFNEEMAKTSNLYKRLAYYISISEDPKDPKDPNIKIKTTTAKPWLSSDSEKKPVHFAVGDKKAYRIETDTEHRTAICNFNNPPVAEGAAAFFDTLFNRNDSQAVDLNNLF